MVESKRRTLVNSCLQTERYYYMRQRLVEEMQSAMNDKKKGGTFC
jgi:hypothetical protein